MGDLTALTRTVFGAPKAVAVLATAALLASLFAPWFALGTEAPTALDEFDFHLSWGLFDAGSRDPPGMEGFRSTYPVGLFSGHLPPAPLVGEETAIPWLAVACALTAALAGTASLVGRWARRLPSWWSPAVMGVGGAQAITATLAFMLGLPAVWDTIRALTVFGASVEGPWRTFGGGTTFEFTGLQQGVLRMQWGPEWGWFLCLAAGFAMLAAAWMMATGEKKRPTGRPTSREAAAPQSVSWSGSIRGPATARSLPSGWSTASRQGTRATSGRLRGPRAH